MGPLFWLTTEVKVGLGLVLASLLLFVLTGFMVLNPEVQEALGSAGVAASFP